ncbi:MAG: glycosyltransferase family 4 protein [Xanthobacteraceae bacterium]|jgi:glycosyltransferase involved in cell wall biosynthesis
MRVLVATDAWQPQVNGVVRFLEYLAREAISLGSEIVFLTPNEFRTLPLPGYSEIRLALASPGAVARAIAEARPDSVHIATEGPIGWLARRACRSLGLPFTTSFHTRFPEYVAARLPVPQAWSYAALRAFHNAALCTMVGSAMLEAELRARGFNNLARWSPGVDTELFRPQPRRPLTFPGPVFMFVGRVAVEKNLEAFLRLDLPGTKVVVGDGPLRASIEPRFPDVHFLGMQTGQALVDAYASADVLVFPSLTDTFGMVILEALACGVPVAAFPVMGPYDILNNSGAGCLDLDLRRAALGALEIPAERCRAYALEFSWQSSARQFLDNTRRARNLGDARVDQPAL